MGFFAEEFQRRATTARRVAQVENDHVYAVVITVTTEQDEVAEVRAGLRSLVDR